MIPSDVYETLFARHDSARIAYNRFVTRETVITGLMVVSAGSLLSEGPAEQWWVLGGAAVAVGGAIEGRRARNAFEQAIGWFNRWLSSG